MLGDALAAEITAALDAHEQAIKDPLEGMRDSNRAAVAPPEEPLKRESSRLADADQKRLDLSRFVREALAMLLAKIENLETDGFPTLPSYEMQADAYAQLQANVVTMKAALARAKPVPPDAVSGTVESKGVVPA